ncbi:MAG: hypothetical protein CM1200mP1_06690 [Candidatus Neomarinimicrobiota bacterium]|nr:MAG: hypothetical protein CM1200mP1_06690 [Candidatus Neomarinimicrobiota bacterium]
MYLYHPQEKSTSVRRCYTGLNLYLLVTCMAWRKKKYSLYSGFDIICLLVSLLLSLTPKDIDTNGVPKKFKQYHRKRLTQWRIKAFGEFYRKFRGPLININWSTIFHFLIENKSIHLFFSFS